MKLEDQLVSLRPAKKLKKLGFPQKSLWYWYRIVGCSIKPSRIVSAEELGRLIEENKKDYVMEYSSAYTIAELEQWIPDKYQVIKVDSDYWIGAKEVYGFLRDQTPKWALTKSGFLRQGLPDWMFNVIKGSGIGGKKHADVLAKIPIYLEKNNLV